MTNFKVSVVQHEGSHYDVVGMCIVPVRLSHRDTSKQVLVYAMLDECSQGTFIKEEILDMFDIEKRNTSITVTTLNGEETYNSHVVDGFSIQCSLKHERLYPQSCNINLPVIFSRQHLPIDENDVPVAEGISRWKYLKKIGDTLSDGKDIPIALLIGGNCHKALEPLEVVPSQGEGPYAYRTQLGWCVVGPTDKCMIEPVKCNFNKMRWPAKDISTGLSAQHHFAITSSVKDNSTNKI